MASSSPLLGRRREPEPDNYLVVTYHIKKNTISSKYYSDFPQTRSVTDYLFYTNRYKDPLSFSKESAFTKEAYTQSTTSFKNGKQATTTIQFLLLSKLELNYLKRHDRMMIGDHELTIIRTPDTYWHWWIRKKDSDDYFIFRKCLQKYMKGGFYCVIYHHQYVDKKGKTQE